MSQKNSNNIPRNSNNQCQVIQRKAWAKYVGCQKMNKNTSSSINMTLLQINKLYHIPTQIRSILKQA